MIHAWYLRRLREFMAAAAASGSKEEHERGLKLLREFNDLLAGETPELDTEERLRQRWGMSSQAQEGQAAMLTMPGVAGFTLDDDEADPVPPEQP